MAGFMSMRKTRRVIANEVKQSHKRSIIKEIATAPHAPLGAVARLAITGSEFFKALRMGIAAGGVVILEEREDEVALRPAAVLEIETYGDVDIARWNAEDHLDEAERMNILKKFEDKT